MARVSLGLIETDIESLAIVHCRNKPLLDAFRKTALMGNSTTFIFGRTLY
jgi:hypothetical protein